MTRPLFASGHDARIEAALVRPLTPQDSRHATPASGDREPGPFGCGIRAEVARNHQGIQNQTVGRRHALQHECPDWIVAYVRFGSNLACQRMAKQTFVGSIRCFARPGIEPDRSNSRRPGTRSQERACLRFVENVAKTQIFSNHSAFFASRREQSESQQPSVGLVPVGSSPDIDDKRYG